jgi:uncharacterized protein (DUF983 family)
MDKQQEEFAVIKPEGLLRAMGRGFIGRCPACGEGHLFRKFLKVTDHCESCGEAMHHQRADDLPAYLVIVLVGHIIVPMVLAVETAYAPSYLVHLMLWLPLTLGMTLGLLQPTKGSIVGLQWETGMHGFQAARLARIDSAAIIDRTQPAT